MGSVLSLDESSVGWINSLEPEKQKLASSLAIHPASQVQDHLPLVYHYLHTRTIACKHYHSPYGMLDSKVASFLLTDGSKERILSSIAALREEIGKTLQL